MEYGIALGWSIATPLTDLGNHMKIDNDIGTTYTNIYETRFKVLRLLM